MDEFAAKGYAGARTAEIASAAGVNKQLISYHFGGKRGLYDQLLARWNERERDIDTEDSSFAERTLGYVAAALADHRAVRMAMWRELAEGEPPAEEPWGVASDVERIEAERRAGTIREDQDPATLQLLMMGAVVAPVMLTDSVRELFGVDPESPEFRERYEDGLRALLAVLRRE